MSQNTDTILEEMEAKIRDLAIKNDEIEVVWLYGSRAKGNAGINSDWDLAIAFNPRKLTNRLDNRLRPELLALDWQRHLGLAEGKLSIVDINLAPLPLAFSVVNSNHHFYVKNEARRLNEELRVMTLMELDYNHSGKQL